MIGCFVFSSSRSTCALSDRFSAVRRFARNFFLASPCLLFAAFCYVRLFFSGPLVVCSSHHDGWLCSFWLMVAV